MQGTVSNSECLFPDSAFLPLPSIRYMTDMSFEKRSGVISRPIYLIDEKIKSVRSEVTSKDGTNGEQSSESLQLLCPCAHLSSPGQMTAWVWGPQDDDHT